MTVEPVSPAAALSGARRSGVLVPLFSIPSSRSWGIGEIPDIAPVAAWLRAAGQRFVQLLPISEMPSGENSPYSALTAMAIDPQFIGLGSVEDFVATGGEAALPVDLQARLAEVRASTLIDYAGVRELKQVALRRAFAHFHSHEWTTGSARAGTFRRYVEREAAWIDEYALFRALHAEHGERSWVEWPAGLRDREPAALDEARQRLSGEILFRQYLQWVASTQWAEARRASAPTAILGDLPFMVNGDSADVWARQYEFRLDASVGVPPDAFSATGQDWGLPLYRWDVFEQHNFDWLRLRGRRHAALYDGYRVDHLVGFYRTYYRPLDGGEPRFSPSEEAEQIALGERVLETLREAGAEIIAEDLGVIPPFVRESLVRLGVPGYKVFRWERSWHDAGQPFRDPVDYPACSVATSGTHDTETMAVWWRDAPPEERRAVLAIPSMQAALAAADRETAADDPLLRPSVHQALLEVLCGAGSEIVILPIQDLFGWAERINTPATVGGSNWRWRLPWPSEQLLSRPETVLVADRLRASVVRHGR